MLSAGTCPAQRQASGGSGRARGTAAAWLLGGSFPGLGGVRARQGRVPVRMRVPFSVRSPLLSGHSGCRGLRSPLALWLFPLAAGRTLPGQERLSEAHLVGFRLRSPCSRCLPCGALKTVVHTLCPFGRLSLPGLELRAPRPCSLCRGTQMQLSRGVQSASFSVAALQFQNLWSPREIPGAVKCAPHPPLSPAPGTRHLPAVSGPPVPRLDVSCGRNPA